MIHEAEREAQLARIAMRKAEIAAERQAQREAIEAAAAMYAAQHGMIADEPPHRAQPTPREVLDLLGGPEHASYVLSDPAKLAGLPRVVSYSEIAGQRETETLFYERGGGRVPGQESPPAAEPPRPARLPAEWLDDPDCHYDAESLQKIRAAREARPQ